MARLTKEEEKERASDWPSFDTRLRFTQKLVPIAIKKAEESTSARINDELNLNVIMALEQELQEHVEPEIRTQVLITQSEINRVHVMTKTFPLPEHSEPKGVVMSVLMNILKYQ